VCTFGRQFPLDLQISKKWYLNTNGQAPPLWIPSGLHPLAGNFVQFLECDYSNRRKCHIWTAISRDLIIATQQNLQAYIRGQRTIGTHHISNFWNNFFAANTARNFSKKKLVRATNFESRFLSGAAGRMIVKIYNFTKTHRPLTVPGVRNRLLPMKCVYSRL